MPVLASHTDALVSTPAPHPHITTRRTISNLPQLAYLSLGRWHGLDVEHGAQQVLDHLVLVLLASRLDLLDVGLGLLVRLLLGLLVSLGVLESFACTVSYASAHVYTSVQRDDNALPALGLRAYLGLELLVLLLLGRPVLFYLLLGLVTGLLDTLCPVLSGCASIGLGQLSSPVWVLSSGLLFLGISYTSGRSWRRLSRPVVAVSQIYKP